MSVAVVTAADNPRHEGVSHALFAVQTENAQLANFFRQPQPSGNQLRNKPRHRTSHEMRPLLMLPLIFLTTLPACTVIHGTSPAGGRYTYATLGGDASNLEISPASTKAGTVETAPSFREVASVAKTAVVVSGLVDGTNAITGAVKSIKNAKTAADVTKHGATAAVEEQRIAAELAAKVAETNAGGFAQ